MIFALAGTPSFGSTGSAGCPCKNQWRQTSGSAAGLGMDMTAAPTNQELVLTAVGTVLAVWAGMYLIERFAGH